MPTPWRQRAAEPDLCSPRDVEPPRRITFVAIYRKLETVVPLHNSITQHPVGSVWCDASGRNNTRFQIHRLSLSARLATPMQRRASSKRSRVVGPRAADSVISDVPHAEPLAAIVRLGELWNSRVHWGSACDTGLTGPRQPRPVPSAVRLTERPGNAGSQNLTRFGVDLLEDLRGRLETIAANTGTQRGGSRWM